MTFTPEQARERVYTSFFDFKLNQNKVIGLVHPGLSNKNIDPRDGKYRPLAAYCCKLGQNPVTSYRWSESGFEITLLSDPFQATFFVEKYTEDGNGRQTERVEFSGRMVFNVYQDGVEGEEKLYVWNCYLLQEDEPGSEEFIFSFTRF